MKAIQWNEATLLIHTNLRPEENGQSSKAPDQHHGNDSTPSCINQNYVYLLSECM